MAQKLKKLTKTFRRKNKRPGIYSLLFQGTEINIINSGIYSTDNPDLLKIFLTDPELEQEFKEDENDEETETIK